MAIRLLYKGPTGKTHCDKCAGHQSSPLKLGVGYHFRNTETGERFVTGPSCRRKFDGRPESQIPSLIPSGLHLEEERRSGSDPDKKSRYLHEFYAVSVESPQNFYEGDVLSREQLEAFSYLELRRQLYRQGFVNMDDTRLHGCKEVTYPDEMTVAQTRIVMKVMEDSAQKNYLWSVENLKRILHVAQHIEHVLGETRAEGQKNRLAGHWTYLRKNMILTDPQLDDLRRFRSLRKLPTDLSFERTIQPTLDFGL